MSDQTTVDSLLGTAILFPDQWYAVRASAFVRRNAAGKTEVKAFKVNTIEVDSPDEPMPPDETAEPKA